MHKYANIIAFLLAVAAIGLSSPAVCLSDNWTWCENNGNQFSPDLAISSCTALIQSGKESRENLAIAFNDRGIAYNDKKDYDRAIADLNEAIGLDPKYADAFDNRGIAYSGKKDYDRAIADFNEAIRLDPKDALAFNNRGIAYGGKKDTFLPST